MSNKGENRRLQIVIGECKTRRPITGQDVEHLMAIADAFPSNDFDVYVVFAKLSEFTEDEVALIRTLNDQYHRRAIMLTDRELEPSWIYERTHVEFDIDQIAVRFEDLARTTHQVFFEKRRRKPTA